MNLYIIPIMGYMRNNSVVITHNSSLPFEDCDWDNPSSASTDFAFGAMSVVCIKKQLRGCCCDLKVERLNNQ